MEDELSGETPENELPKKKRNPGLSWLGWSIILILGFVAFFVSSLIIHSQFDVPCVGNSVSKDYVAAEAARLRGLIAMSVVFIVMWVLLILRARSSKVHGRWRWIVMAGIWSVPQLSLMYLSLPVEAWFFGLCFA